MGFPERAVSAFLQSMKDGIVSEGQVRCVLRCSQPVLMKIFSENNQIQELEGYLDSSDEMVRLAAMRVVAHTGRVEALIGAALKEKDSGLLIEALQMIGKNADGVEILEGMLSSEDTIVRDEAIEMFRRTGKINSLFPLVFGTDEQMTQRVKRYFDEKRDKVSNP